MNETGVGFALSFLRLLREEAQSFLPHLLAAPRASMFAINL
jgi:hypothetical protein